jgi:hypothetical protein
MSCATARTVIVTCRGPVVLPLMLAAQTSIVIPEMTRLLTFHWLLPPRRDDRVALLFHTVRDYAG